jgi:hypothetical protein
MVSQKQLILALALLVACRTARAEARDDVFLRMHDRTAMVGSSAAGIILGAVGEYLFVLTVKHAFSQLADCKALSITIPGAGADTMRVAGCHLFDDLDAGLLWVTGDKDVIAKYSGKFLPIRTDLISYWPSPPAQSIYTDELVDERVRVVGNPNFHAWTVSSEVAIKRADRAYLELDAGDLGPGYSGGPVFTKQGYVVGMFYGYDNQGYAYRIDALLTVLRRLDNLEFPVGPNGRVPNSIVPMSRIFLANHSRNFYTPTTEGVGLGAGIGLQLFSYTIREAVEISVPLMLELELGSSRAHPDTQRSILFEGRISLGLRYSLLGFMIGAAYNPGYVALEGDSGFQAKALRIELGYQSPQASHGGVVAAVATRWKDSQQDFTFILGYELAYQSAFGGFF